MADQKSVFELWPMANLWGPGLWGLDKPIEMRDSRGEGEGKRMKDFG